jgi:hypothetical protein
VHFISEMFSLRLSMIVIYRIFSALLESAERRIATAAGLSHSLI